MLKTFLMALLAFAAVGSAAQAASAFYEVQHYPANFTTTVNDFATANGSHEYDYGNGDVAKVVYGTNPAPSVFISAQEAQTGAVRVDIFASFEIETTITPLSNVASLALGNFYNSAGTPNPIASLNGYFEVKGGNPTSESAMVSTNQSYRDGDFANLHCGDVNEACGGSAFSVNLYMPLADAHGCPAPGACNCGPGQCGCGGPTTGSCSAFPTIQSFTLTADLMAHLTVNGDGQYAAVFIDPTFSLDPAFLRQYGLSAADFSITPEAGFGNTPNAFPSSGTPEPSTWAMMILGLGATGLLLRRRRHATAGASLA